MNRERSDRSSENTSASSVEPSTAIPGQRLQGGELLDEAFRDAADGEAQGVLHHEGIGSRLAARVQTTCVVSGASSQQARSVDAKELEMELVKVEGTWVIQAIRPVEAMKLD